MLNKNLTTAILFALLLPSVAIAGGRELQTKKFTELSTLAAASVDPANDYIPVYDASQSQVVRVLYGPSSLGTDATGAEITRAADVSARNVALAVDTTLTEALHEGKNLIMGGAGSARTFTLPAATGGGGIYRFIVGAVNTSNYVITRAGSDVIKGGLVFASDNASNAELGFETQTATTITLNGTTKGGAGIGDTLTLIDCAAATWCLSGQVTESGSETTPFS